MSVRISNLDTNYLNRLFFEKLNKCSLEVNLFRYSSSIVVNGQAFIDSYNIFNTINIIALL